MSNLAGSTLSFPFAPDIRGSLKTISNQSEIVVQSIIDVIECRVFERVMILNYGLQDFLFAVQDFTFATRIAFHLQEQILKYVPLVKSVVVKSATDEDGRAIIELQYTEVGEFNSPKNLVYPVWQLQDGGNK